MSDMIPIGQLAEEIRKVYLSDKDRAEKRIEEFLQNRFKNVSSAERLNVTTKLIAEFDSPLPLKTDNFNIDDSVMTQIFSLLLGKDISRADLSSTKLIQRLAESLKTIFDSLNHLIRVINMTLTGESSGEETIRQVIGVHLEGEGQTNSLESYLAQINQAFLTTQNSFKKTVKIIVGQILEEINPDQISTQGGGGLKIGPFRKAEHYEMYEHKFRKIRKWFDSGRFMDDFLREFEKNCQNPS